MKPVPFDYLAPRELDGVLAALAEHGDDAKVLAGGQSLGPLLNLRLAAPAVLVDVNRVDGLASWRAEDDGALALGATMRQRAVEASTEIAARCPLLVDAVRCIAHPTIRNRGTVGGSLVHADPSAELPAVALALGAELVLRSARGARSVRAEDFFLTYFTTATEPDELLLEVRLPALGARTGAAWAEFAPRAGDYFIVGVAAVVALGEDGRIAGVRVAVGGVGDTPTLVQDDVLQAFAGLHPVADADAVQDAGAALADRLPMSAGARSSEAYKRRLVRHLAAQAIREAGERAAR